MTIQVPLSIRQFGVEFVASYQLVVEAVNRIYGSGQLRARSYTVSTAPSASGVSAGSIIYVSDETGGAVLAFSDGSDWRRVTDRMVIS